MPNAALLKQLDYPVTDSALAQVEKVKQNTKITRYLEKILV